MIHRIVLIVVSAILLTRGSAAQEATKKVLLDEMVAFEAQEAIARDSLFIVLFGDIEFHGPAAPFGTDNFNVWEVAKRVAARVDSAVLLPVMPFGVTPPPLMKFAGSLTLREETFRNVVREILESLIGQDAKKLLVLSGHGGNTGPMQQVCAEVLKAHPGIFLKCAMWIEYAPDKDLKDMFTVVGGHGGAREVSGTLVAKPGLIDLSKIDFQNFPGRDEIWHGTPEEASKDKGERIFQLAVGNIIAMLRENGVRTKD